MSCFSFLKAALCATGYTYMLHIVKVFLHGLQTCSDGESICILQLSCLPSNLARADRALRGWVCAVDGLKILRLLPAGTNFRALPVRRLGSTYMMSPPAFQYIYAMAFGYEPSG